MEKSNRCEFPGCKKKLDLVSQSIKCRCNKTYCLTHRLVENHACPFNYFKENQEILNKTMSTPIVASKVDKNW